MGRGRVGAQNEAKQTGLHRSKRVSWFDGEPEQQRRQNQPALARPPALARSPPRSPARSRDFFICSELIRC